MIVPNASPGILAGSLMVVTLSLGEFNLTWMLHTPLTKTLPVGLADSYASKRLEVASAYTLVFFVMIIPLLVAMQLFADRGVSSAEHGDERGKRRGHGACQACAKTFGDGTRALKPVTLDVARGETIVFLGPSGCGKTTMLRIIAGLEEPDPGGPGAVQRRRRDRGADRAAQCRHGVPVLRAVAPYEVDENIGFRLELRGVPAAERQGRVAELIHLDAASRVRATSIDQLSGGQRRRSRWRARSWLPRVLLLDEPLTARCRLRERWAGLRPAAAMLGITADLRHPRPGRSPGARRPHRGDAQGRDRADRHAARRLLQPRGTALSRNSSAPPT